MKLEIVYKSKPGMQVNEKESAGSESQKIKIYQSDTMDEDMIEAVDCWHVSNSMVDRVILNDVQLSDYESIERLRLFLSKLMKNFPGRHKEERNWNEVGMIAVDSGTILIADPVNVLSENDYQKYVVKDMDHKTTKQIVNEYGAEVGIINTTHVGDGIFPVYEEDVCGADGIRRRSLIISFQDKTRDDN